MPDSDLILKKAEELVREVRRLLDSPADRAALRHSLGGPAGRRHPGGAPDRHPAPARPAAR
jgi:hypothetical protein